jgi:peptide/nickel transport system substrate-binding protein
MELSHKLQIANLALVGAAVVALTMNTCAMDRLEAQVIRNTQATQALAEGGGGVASTASAVRASAGVPGQPTGFEATGWGGKRAAITHVEGAAEGAPLRLQDKPRPQNDTYVNRRTSAPGTLNYYASSEGDTNTITAYTIERLIRLDPDAPPAVQPALATSWEVSEDHLTYTFHLRRGVQFADGRPLTSADVRFSYEVMRDPAVKADHLRSEFDDVVELSTPDDYTVVVRYRRPYWKGLYTVGYALRVLNRGWYEEQIPVHARKLGVTAFSTTPGQPGFGEVFNKIRVPPPGTGPYYFAGEDYDPKAGIELVQNPFYWGTQVDPTFWNFKKIRYVFISDPVAAFEAFRKQQFDVTVVDFQEWDDEYSEDPTITGISKYVEYDHTGIGWSEIVWNNRQPPFDDPRVRRAMAHLVNREWILSEIERGRGRVAVCPSKPSFPEYPLDLEPIPYDPEAARALLAEAGWKDSDGDGVLDKGGRRFEFELKVGSARRFYTQVAAQLDDASRKVGIRMSLRTLEWATFVQDLESRNFDAAVLYDGPPDPWVDSYVKLHSSQDIPGAENNAGWHSDRADALLEAMRTEFDAGKRNAMYKEMCGIFQEEQPNTLLLHGLVGVLVHSRLEGAKVRPTGLQAFDMYVKPENVLHP